MTLTAPLAPAPRPTGHRRRRPAHPGLVLGVVLLAAYAINLDTTVVNVALPSLGSALDASTSRLQWVVDGYNLAFAALVLAGGTIADRYGRRGALGAGLTVFGAASAASAFAGSSLQLVVLRAVAGAGAALIFPSTLSVISDVFRERRARARAIGLWGAVTGLGVATGPVIGGALLEHAWWGSVFLALVPVAVLALAGTLLAVPRSAHPASPPLDRAGLVLSVAGLGLLVHGLIEAPSRGWTTPGTLAELGGALAVLVVLVRCELRRTHPMLDVRLFANPRFAAACGAVTAAYFALFGFIFLVAQYFQLLRGYGPLETGVRMLPVAGSIAVASSLGTALAVRLGTRVVVASGLVLLASAFGWIATVPVDAPFAAIVGQMVLLGGGLGLTTAPATEAVMGVVRPEQAGAGSAVNDATREVGGTLGVAVLGSIASSAYAGSLDSRDLAGVPAHALAAARESLGAGLAASRQLDGANGIVPARAVGALHDAVVSGFMDGLHLGCTAAAVLCAVAAVAVGVLLPAQPGR